MNAIKGFILSIIVGIVFWGSACIIGTWVSLAYASYVNTTNYFLIKAQER